MPNTTLEHFFIKRYFMEIYKIIFNDNKIVNKLNRLSMLRYFFTSCLIEADCPKCVLLQDKPIETF